MGGIGRLQAVRQRLGAAVDVVHKMMAQLFSPTLRRTTLLLLFIWFANAISYYGLVLLATSARRPPPAPPRTQPRPLAHPAARARV